MADSDSSLLIRIKGDSSSGKAAIAETRAAIASLRSTSSKEFGVMQGVASRSFGSITQNLNQFVGQVPVVGTAVTSLSSQFGALASPMGIAALASLALGGALISLSTKLFQVVEQSSKLGGEIHDLTLQTGLGAERLTALKFATDQSGGSIEKFSNGLKIFAIEIANANKGSEEAIAKLKRLGVEPKEGLFDLDAALTQALQTIAKAPAGVAQMTLAAEAFGRKIGPDLIPTIVSFDGNLDALTKRARELGLTLTDVQVKSLDDFGDAFDTIKLQATLAAAQFSSTVAPEITRAMMSITQGVGDNRGAFQQWGVAVADTFRGVRSLAESELGQVIRMLAEMNFLLPLTALRGLRALGESQRPTTAGEDFFGPGGTARGGRASLPGTPEARAAEARRAQLEQFQRELAEQGKTGGGGGRAARDTGAAAALRELQAQEDVNNALIDSYNKLTDELDGVNTATRAYAVEQEILNGKLKDATPLLQAEARENASLADAAEKSLRLQKQLHEFRVQQSKDVKQVLEGERGHIDQAQDLINSLEAETVVVEDAAKFWLLFRSGILASNDALKMIAETMASMPPLLPPEGGFDTGEGDLGAIGKVIEKDLGPPPVRPEVIDSWKILRGVSTDALKDMASGIGGLVQQWVLYGSAGPNAMRKMVASVLAGVAAQAAVKAIFELAEGWAALGNPFLAWTAPFHFKSAALFAGIAGVSAAAGRVAAGNSFSESGAGDSRASSSGGQATSASGTPRTIEADRRSSGGNVTATIQESIERAISRGFNGLMLRAEVTRDEGSTVRMWVDNYRNNGVTRKLVTEDG